MIILAGGAEGEVMQCKDIPDWPILEFLSRRKDIPATWFPGFEHSVAQAMQAGIDEHLIQAKMRQLIKRGLVDGCDCGCRGDYTITKKGEEFLQEFSIGVPKPC